MTFAQALLKTEMRGLAALVAVSLVVSVGFALDEWLTPIGIGGVDSAGALAFQLVFLTGLLPVTIYGAPLYAWLQGRALLTWPRVVALGALPSALLALFFWPWGVLALPCGVAIACATHYLSKDDVASVRSNTALERSRDA